MTFATLFIATGATAIGLVAIVAIYDAIENWIERKARK